MDRSFFRFGVCLPVLLMALSCATPSALLLSIKDKSTTTTGGTTGPATLTGIVIAPSDVTVAPGNTVKLTASPVPAAATLSAVTWTSDIPAIATVDATGLVTAVSAGTSTIHAQDSAGHSKTSTVRVQAAGSASTARNAIGINLSWNSTSDYSQDRLFADAVKSARGWYHISDNSFVPASELDANRWPLGDVQLLLMAGLDKHDGLYSGSFTGVGTVGVGTYGASGLSGLTQSYDSGTNKTTFSFTITSGGSNAIELKFTGTSGGIKNLSIMRPTSNGASTSFPAGQVFTDQILSFLSNFQAIRFMDYSWVNGSRIVNWADRAKLTDAMWSIAYNSTTYNSVVYNDGGPWEAAIDLCNAAGCDLWINIPLFASDDYVTNLATLIKTRLNSSLNVYVEYCNEVWNTAGAFPQGNWNHDQAKADVSANVLPALNYDGSTNDWYWAWRRVGRRIVEISNLFRTVWGDADMPALGKAAPRVRPILASQLGYDEVLKQPVELISSRYPQPLAYYLYGIGGSAYWNSSDLSSVSAYFAAPTVAATEAKFRSQAALALGFGLKRIAYEGGPSLDKGTTAANTVQAAVWADPQMRTLLAGVHDGAWSSTGGDLLMYYEATGDFQWGFATTLFDTASSPKLQAVQDLKAATRAAPASWTLLPGHLDGKTDAAFSLITGNSYTVTEGLVVNSGTTGPSFLTFPFRVGSDGSYTLKLTARFSAGFHVAVDGVDLTSLPAQSTTATLNVGTVTLTQGAHAIRLWIEPSASMVIGSMDLAAL